MKYFDIIHQGGFFMYPILAVSILGLSLICERSYYLFFKLNLNAKEFGRRILRMIEAGDINGAIQLCHKHHNHPISEVLNAALMKANRNDKEIERAIQGKYIEVSSPIQENVSYLSLMANVATLLGLLGTIYGLIQAFKGVALADAAMKQEVLAKGISIAMGTTAFGLIVAIPCLIGFHFLTDRQNRILESIQEAATNLLNLISASNRDLRAGPRRVERVSEHTV